MTAIVGVLLAAGASRRFGSDKLLARLPNGEPVALQTCRLLSAGCDQILAVVRPGNPELNAVLRSGGAELIVCEQADLGMGHSLASGIAASLTAQGWIIGLADMPWIKPATVRRVADRLRADAQLVAPVWQGRRGHPVGFARQFATELQTLQGDNGAKTIIQAHQAELELLDSNDPGILWDIDHPADLNYLTNKHSGND